MSESRPEMETVREWRHSGLACKLVKNPIGFYCGYVQVPPETIKTTRFESRYDEMDGVIEADVTAHGGITYGPDADGWVGFDCGHAGDTCLNEDGEEWGSLPSFGDRFIWERSDVVEEVESLAEQLSDEQ